MGSPNFMYLIRMIWNENYAVFGFNSNIHLMELTITFAQ